MRVLTDACHADLLESLYLLLEDRLGMELHVLTGMGWYTEGIWRFERERLGDQVARQFLIGTAMPSHPHRQLRLATIEQAREERWDLVICTLAENEDGLHTFARQVGAHYGVQVGNQDALTRWHQAEFALLSVSTPGIRPWVPHVYYHQEFSLDAFWADGGAGAEPDLVQNRVQCITQTADYGTFRELARLVPELRWRWYGHCEPTDELWGGNAATTAEVAASMHSARIAYHAKRWSDGYGHVVHDWFAIGRPVLGTATYYRDKLAGPLFVEGITSYDLESHSTEELVAIIRRLARDEEHWRGMCEAAARRFREVVNFDEEAAAIRTMLDGVLSDRLVRT